MNNQVTGLQKPLRVFKLGFLYSLFQLKLHSFLYWYLKVCVWEPWMEYVFAASIYLGKDKHLLESKVCFLPFKIFIISSIEEIG